MKRGIHDLVDRRYELEHQVQREPLKAIGLAFGVGVLIGVATTVVWRAARCNANGDAAQS